jgi:hypothetical protein
MVTVPMKTSVGRRPMTSARSPRGREAIPKPAKLSIISDCTRPWTWSSARGEGDGVGQRLVGGGAGAGDGHGEERHGEVRGQAGGGHSGTEDQSGHDHDPPGASGVGPAGDRQGDQDGTHGAGRAEQAHRAVPQGELVEHQWRDERDVAEPEHDDEERADHQQPQAGLAGDVANAVDQLAHRVASARLRAGDAGREPEQLQQRDHAHHCGQQIGTADADEGHTGERTGERRCEHPGAVHAEHGQRDGVADLLPAHQFHGVGHAGRAEEPEGGALDHRGEHEHPQGGEVADDGRP